MGLFDQLAQARLPSTAAEPRQVPVPNHGQSAEQWLAQGMALEQQGQMEQALYCYESAIALTPELARAHFNRGNILLDRGDAQAALEAYTQAVQYKPDSAGTHFNLGAAYTRLGRTQDAVTAYRQAIVLKPDFADAHLGLASALQELGHEEAAVESYRHLLQIQPDNAPVHDTLAKLLVKLGRLEQAADCYHRVLQLEPNNVSLMFSLASVLRTLGCLREAATFLRRALEFEPNFVDALGCLGDISLALRSYDDAISSYRRVLEIEPGNTGAHNNLGTAFKDVGRFDDALASYRSALAIDPDFTVAHSNLLMLQHFSLNQTPQFFFEEARRFGAMVARRAPAPVGFQNSADPHRCLRVGFVSGDLRTHPVGYFLENVLSTLSVEASTRLRLFAYSNSSNDDLVTERLKRHFRGWRAVLEHSDEALVRCIRDDQIDMLIDLSGHTGKNRLPVFAWRAAPVQVTWLGYFATTGVQAIDYLIADSWTLPEDEECNFTEKVWRLPDTRLCFTPPAPDLDITPLPALRNGYVTFASFNALPKINDAVASLWARILHAVPDSRLHLMALQLAEPVAQDSLVARFAALGIEPERLLVQGPRPRTEYLATYQRVDIALDPFPYTGGTTTTEALWMGVPVLTLAGESFLARQGVGLLMNAGLSDWVASDSDDYLARAISHARDVQRLALLRSRLRKQVLTSPILDAQRFAVHFEAALRGMWQRWCESNSQTR